MLVELGKNQNVYKLCNIPGVTVRPKRGKDECLGRPGCGFKAVATELFRTGASELSPIVLNIFQLGCTTRPHCPPQDWLPYCLYPPCTLDNCHSLCPCLAVCLFTVALDHLCTFVPLYLHGIQSAGTDSSGALQARHARAWSPPEPDKRRFNYGAGSNFPVKTRSPDCWSFRSGTNGGNGFNIFAATGRNIFCDKILTCRGFSG